MKWFTILLSLFLKVLHVENRMIPLNFVTMPTVKEESVPPTIVNIEEIQTKSIDLRNFDDIDHDDYSFELEKKPNSERNRKPCAIVVLSNIQNPNMQSLLRKYRYDAQGVLIPSSVKYFMKLPQGRKAPILVPLNDKAFSPLGGFVRYYKEVPPIPQLW